MFDQGVTFDNRTCTRLCYEYPGAVSMSEKDGSIYFYLSVLSIIGELGLDIVE